MEVVGGPPQDPGRASETAEPSFPLVVIASSAGGIKALGRVLSILPHDLPAAVAIVQHLAPWHPSQLAHILRARTRLTVKQAEEGDLLRPGTVFVAPPNKHLLVNPDRTLSLSFSEMVHFLRPSADLLFESAAASFRGHAIAVVLSGSGSDGAMGVQAIKRMGGTVIAQSVATSEFQGMPAAAAETGDVDFILPIDEIALKIRDLTGGDRTA